MITAFRNAGILLVMAQLSACAAPSPDPKPHDPHAVQIGSAGEADCRPTSRAENAAGAAATNAARLRAGLPPVASSMTLAQVAAAHACDMAQRGRMTHIGTSTKGPGDRLRRAGYQPAISAENIAAGPFTLTRVLGEWQTSPGHHSNIMLPQVREYGLGQAVGADGRTRYWAAVYAAPR